MFSKTKILGMTVASAAALAFTAMPVSMSVANVMGKAGEHVCHGANSCKGQGFIHTKTKKECEEKQAEIKKEMEAAPQMQPTTPAPTEAAQAADQAGTAPASTSAETPAPAAKSTTQEGKKATGTKKHHHKKKHHKKTTKSKKAAQPESAKP